MKKFLIPIFFALTIFSPVKANIDREVAEMCMKAVDFKGCIETMSGQTNKKRNSTYENNREIEVKAPPEHSFEQDSVLQLKIRGRYGRYITFKGRTKVPYKGTDSYTIGGGVANTNCYGSSCTTYYTPPTTISGTAGGIQHRTFVYELDCIDLTFNRIGDKHTAGGGSWGWLPVNRDPVADEVSRRYCPIINTLPKKF